jgi:hypothetical protein
MSFQPYPRATALPPLWPVIASLMSSFTLAARSASLKPCRNEWKTLLGFVMPSLDDGTAVQLYPEAEEILSHLKQLGTPMILREVDPPTDKRYVRPGQQAVNKPYSFSGMQKIVQRMRKEIGLPIEFTLDACRHGGMTELEEAELTEGQGRALSAHRTRESYAGYAKRTAPRILAATRKRRAHVLANQTQTEFQNEQPTEFQNEKSASA